MSDEHRQQNLRQYLLQVTGTPGAPMTPDSLEGYHESTMGEDPGIARSAVLGRRAETGAGGTRGLGCSQRRAAGVSRFARR